MTLTLLLALALLGLLASFLPERLSAGSTVLLLCLIGYVLVIAYSAAKG